MQHHKRLLYTFFALLENNDTQQIKQALPAEKVALHNTLNDWQKWITLWNSYELVSVGKSKLSTYQNSNNERAFVSVILKIENKDVNGTIKVSRINGMWVWDEN